MPFTDPVVGGTELIRDAIHSSNYVPGTSGWSINRDGSAQFNDVTITGGELLVSDVDGSYIHVFDENPGAGAVIAWKGADQPGHVIGEGSLKTAWTGVQAYASIDGPSQDGNGNAVLSMYAESSTGDPATATLAAQSINLYAQSGTPSTVDIRTLGAGQITIGQNTSDTLLVDAEEIERPSGNRAWMLTFIDTNNATSALTLTGSNQNVPNCNFTITTTYPNAQYEATIVADMSAGSASWVGVAELQLNGAAIGPQAIMGGTTGSRGTVAQTYSGSLATPGSYTFQMRGARAGGTGGTFNATHTTLQLKVYE